VTPIQVMKEFYNGASVAFRTKGENEWYLCLKPLWLWGINDYKVVDLDFDDDFLW